MTSHIDGGLGQAPARARFARGVCLALAVAGSACGNGPEPAGASSPRAAAPPATSVAPASTSQPEVSGPLASVAWLVGSWAGTTPDGATVEETWSVDGAALKGVGRTVGKDGKENGEALRIEARDGAVVYVAQPGAAAKTDFTLDPRTSGETHAQFVNEAHDWPTRIRYERSGEALKVRVRGRPGQPDETWTLQKKK